MSPNAKRRVAWARARVAVAETREFPADNKYACQKALLAPHAALVMRFDGAVMRVVAVHRPATEALCTVDLVRGYDDLMLSDLPAASAEAAASAMASGGAYRLSAAAQSTFFASVLFSGSASMPAFSMPASSDA